MTGRFVDLNADVGEEGLYDEELLAIVTSASVACGYHAGSPAVMLATAAEAARRGVAVGAHPSYDDREGFGRRPVDIPAPDLFAAVVYQVGAMRAAAVAAGTGLAFVKPHGALYNRAASEAEVAHPVVLAAATLGLPVLGPPGSELERAASAQGVRLYREAFADRAYEADGSLAPRDHAGAVIEDPAEAARQAVDLVLRGTVRIRDGTEIPLSADSICIHGDTPGAVAVARAVRRALEGAGVSVRPFATEQL